MRIDWYVYGSSMARLQPGIRAFLSVPLRFSRLLGFVRLYMYVLQILNAVARFLNKPIVGYSCVGKTCYSEVLD